MREAKNLVLAAAVALPSARVANKRLLLLCALLWSMCDAAHAIEGPSGAGPIGGTDIRSAVLPPPGLYGGMPVLVGHIFDFVGPKGQTIPLLSNAQVTREFAGPFLYYVPETKVLGGSIGWGVEVPFGNQCGHLFLGTSDECSNGLGDPYAEIDWSRYFGKPRPSRFDGAYPILQGLTVLAGFGTVFPAGSYDASTPLNKALSIGSNIWDFAPALTYTTAPILIEGTEISAKFYSNNYLENPETHYLTGQLLDLDFAVTEHVGRFQIGATGFYATQIEDDKRFGVPVPPNGNRGEILQLGGIVAYDLPELNTSMKLKAFTSVFAANTTVALSCSAGSQSSERISGRCWLRDLTSGIITLLFQNFG